VARFLSNGSPDPSFGSGGKLTMDVAAPDRGNGLAIQPDGKILVATGSLLDSGLSMSVARLLTNGALDPSFGTGGKVAVPIGDATFANAIALQPDGKIVLAGTADSDFAAVRLLGDPGSADTTAPDLASASLSNKRFRVGTPPTAETAAKRRRKAAPKGTAFRYTLSERAKVTIAIDRGAAGLKLRRKGRKKANCVSASRRNKRALRRQLLKTKAIKRLHGRRKAKALKRATRKRGCRLYRRVGTLTRSAQGPGKVTTPFSGRIGRRALKPGRYRATLQATDAASNASKARRLTFTVVKRA
jgi:uncharacterized delta-60 repeat protein